MRMSARTAWARLAELSSSTATAAPAASGSTATTSIVNIRTHRQLLVLLLSQILARKVVVWIVVWVQTLSKRAAGYLLRRCERV